MAIETARDPRAFLEFERAGWAGSGPGYVAHWTGVTEQCAGATLDAVGIAPNVRLLDVCTGPGILARAAADRGASVTALDFSEELLAIARRAVPDADFRQGDAQSLPFEDDGFDAVVCGFGLMHLARPDVALREMRRVLQPGGRLAVSVWDAPAPGNGLGVLHGAIRAHGNLDVPLPHGPDFFQFSSTERMTDALQSQGLERVNVVHVPQSWELAEPSDLIRAVEQGAVRVRAVLLAQTDDARRAIEAAVERGMAQFRTDAGTFAVPMPAVLGIAAK